MVPVTGRERTMEHPAETRVATVHRTVAFTWVRARRLYQNKKEPAGSFFILVRVFLWDFSKNAVIPTFFGISEHQISLFTSQNAPEIFLGLAAQNGIVVTPRHLFYFNLLSLSL